MHTYVARLAPTPSDVLRTMHAPTLGDLQTLVAAGLGIPEASVSALPPELRQVPILPRLTGVPDPLITSLMAAAKERECTRCDVVDPRRYWVFRTAVGFEVIT